MGLVSVAMIFGMPKLMENSTFCSRDLRRNAWFGCGFTDYCAQWTTRLRRKWKRSSRALLAVLRVLLSRFRTSIWLDSCPGSLVVVIRLERRRRSERLYTEWNRVLHLQAAGTWTLILKDTLSMSVFALQHNATCSDCLSKTFTPCRTSFAIALLLSANSHAAQPVKKSDNDPLCSDFLTFPSAHLA
jgi:hypothetical protein